MQIMAIQKLHQIVVKQITKHLQYYHSILLSNNTNTNFNTNINSNSLPTSHYTHQIIHRLLYDILQLQNQSIQFIMKQIFDYPKQYKWTLHQILKIVLDVQFVITVNNHVMVRVIGNNLNSDNSKNGSNNSNNNNNKDISLCKINCHQLTSILYDNCFFLPKQSISYELIQQIVNDIDQTNGKKGYVLLVQYKTYMYQHIIQKHTVHSRLSLSASINNNNNNSGSPLNSNKINNNNNYGNKEFKLYDGSPSLSSNSPTISISLDKKQRSFRLNQDSIKQAENQQSEIILINGNGGNGGGGEDNNNNVVGNNDNYENKNSCIKQQEVYVLAFDNGSVGDDDFSNSNSKNNKVDINNKNNKDRIIQTQSIENDSLQNSNTNNDQNNYQTNNYNNHQTNKSTINLDNLQLLQHSRTRSKKQYNNDLQQQQQIKDKLSLRQQQKQQYNLQQPRQQQQLQSSVQQYSYVIQQRRRLLMYDNLQQYQQKQNHRNNNVNKQLKQQSQQQKQLQQYQQQTLITNLHSIVYNKLQQHAINNISTHHNHQSSKSLLLANLRQFLIGCMVKLTSNKLNINANGKQYQSMGISDCSNDLLGVEQCQYTTAVVIVDRIVGKLKQVIQQMISYDEQQQQQIDYYSNNFNKSTTKSITTNIYTVSIHDNNNIYNNRNINQVINMKQHNKNKIIISSLIRLLGEEGFKRYHDDNRSKQNNNNNINSNTNKSYKFTLSQQQLQAILTQSYIILVANQIQQKQMRKLIAKLVCCQVKNNKNNRNKYTLQNDYNYQSNNNNNKSPSSQLTFSYINYLQLVQKLSTGLD